MAKNAVAVKPANAVSTESADFMKKYGAVGTESIAASEVETPRLVLMQALSPEVEKHGAKQGAYWHSVLELDLGSTLKVVPIYVEKTAVLWRPRSEGGGILARQVGNVWEPSNTKFEVTQAGRTVIWDTKGSVAESRLLEWGSSIPGDPRSLPAATLTINFVFMLPERLDASPVIMSFSKTAIKPANKLLSALKLSGRPSFGMRFVMSSDKVSNPKGSFFMPKFTMDGLTSEAECDEYFKLYKVFANKERAIGAVDADDEGNDVESEGRF
jgi:hypothetical protein